MDKFALPHAKLLYGIYQLSKSARIGPDEKRKLKELVFTEDETLFSVLRNFDKDPTLLQQIHAVVKPSTRGKPSSIIPTKEYGDEITSPIGTYLHDKKKKQHGESEFHISLTSFTPDILAEDETIEVPDESN